MYYYASKLSAIACGTRCKQAVLQKNRGQRDRDKLRRLRTGHDDDHDIDSDDIDCDLQVSAISFFSTTCIRIFTYQEFGLRLSLRSYQITFITTMYGGEFCCFCVP